MLVPQAGDEPSGRDDGDEADGEDSSDTPDEEEESSSKGETEFDEEEGSFNPLDSDPRKKPMMYVSTSVPCSILGLPSRSSLTKSARSELRVYLPKSYKCFKCTNEKLALIMNQLVRASFIEKCNKDDVKYVHAVCLIYKDSTCSRAIYDMSALVDFEVYRPPEFTLVR